METKRKPLVVSGLAVALTWLLGVERARPAAARGRPTYR